MRGRDLNFPAGRLNRGENYFFYKGRSQPVYVRQNLEINFRGGEVDG